MTEPPAEILLVDDNPQDAELVMHTLRRHHPGLAVRHARDGAEAITMLGKWPGPQVPCLILLDLKMPKVDGFEVLRWVRGDADLRLIPVVVLTSSDLQRDVQRAYELGASSYVVKPMDFEHFTETLRRVVDYWVPVDRGPQR